MFSQLKKTLEIPYVRNVHVSYRIAEIRERFRNLKRYMEKAQKESVSMNEKIHGNSLTEKYFGKQADSITERYNGIISRLNQYESFLQEERYEDALYIMGFIQKEIQEAEKTVEGFRNELTKWISEYPC